MSSHIPQRSGQKKDRKINTILNLSIGLVALLIAVVSVGLIVGGSEETASEEEAQENRENISVGSDAEENDGNFENNLAAGRDNVENDSETEENDNEENADNQDSGNNNSSGNNEENNNSRNNDNNSNNQNNEEDENNENNEENESNEGAGEDEWEPVGTSQENFSLDFDRGGQNWNEMIEAISYATGLPSDEDQLTVHRLENGGTQYSAVGTVSASDGDRDRPYQVRLEWVENEGWQPVSVERLDSNPY